MTMNDEELFEHLQELVAELPAMQEKGAVLARARAAAEVAKRAHYYEGQHNELNGILSEMAENGRGRSPSSKATVNAKKRSAPLS